MSVAIDVDAAVGFVARHGRVLERRRLDLLLGRGDAEGVLGALDAYRNADGGYGWGIEPDLRSPESQPVGAMHALEVLAEVTAVAPITTARALALFDWLAAHSRSDGALPFTLPVQQPASCAGLWLGDDHTTGSLQMTAQVVAKAHLLARHEPAVAAHPWLAPATQWTLDAIDRLTDPQAHELLFAVRFLDAVAATDGEGRRLLDDVGRFVPADGVVPVAGGAPDEALRPLDFAPRADGPARGLFAGDVIAAELARFAAAQQPDGGWTVDFVSASPAGALEWRGYVTVAAVATLAGAG